MRGIANVLRNKLRLIFLKKTTPIKQFSIESFKAKTMRLGWLITIYTPMHVNPKQTIIVRNPRRPQLVLLCQSLIGWEYGTKCCLWLVETVARYLVLPTAIQTDVNVRLLLEFTETPFFSVNKQTRNQLSQQPQCPMNGIVPSLVSDVPSTVLVSNIARSIHSRCFCIQANRILLTVNQQEHPATVEGKVTDKPCKQPWCNVFTHLLSDFSISSSHLHA